MTLKQLQTDAHRIAVDKGWWDPPPSDDAVWCNFLAEVSEAWEEYRAGWPLADIRVVGGKPEGFFVELADLVIRIADYVEAKGWEIGAEAVPATGSVATVCMCITEHLMLADREEDSDKLTGLAFALGNCFALAKRHGVNLRDVVRLKMDYNRTRPHRHGGKIA